MAQFDPYYMIARRLAKKQFDKNDLLTITTFMIEDIERLIGPKLTDHAYQFEGIYFGSTHPQMEYRKHDGKHVTKIRLSSGCASKPGSALWQLAHECVHLITPHARSTVLEEGIACWYQERWVDKIPQVFPEWIKERRAEGYFPSYDEAYVLVNEMMLRDPDVIRRLREKQPIICKITATMLKKEAPWLGRELATKLASKFERGRPRRRPQLPASIKEFKAKQKLLVETVIETVQPLDPRASEIARQAARLVVGMSLMKERIAQLGISEEDVHSAVARMYGT